MFENWRFRHARGNSVDPNAVGFIEDGARSRKMDNTGLGPGIGGIGGQRAGRAGRTGVDHNAAAMIPHVTDRQRCRLGYRDQIDLDNQPHALQVAVGKGWRPEDDARIVEDNIDCAKTCMGVGVHALE